VLDAGRADPNFFNIPARHAFFRLGAFSVEQAPSRDNCPHVGFRRGKNGIALDLHNYLSANPGPGTAFLSGALHYAGQTLGLGDDDLVYELVDASLGDHYPDPPRMEPRIGQSVRAYLASTLFRGARFAENLDLFATEGATAAMIYIFRSLRANRLLLPGDRIALVTPIFSPYLDLPSLSDCHLVKVPLEMDPREDSYIPDGEIAKLGDPRVRALFMVNPTNPTSVGIAKESLRKIARLVREERNDLIVITDSVYAALINRHHDIMSEIPENTLCVFSFSKYFGVTGWRLGVIAVHRDNVIDRLLARLPDKDRADLAERYRIVSRDPQEIKFIDRLAMDSRDIALAHTGGLSGPQQAMMCLLSLFGLTDQNRAYKSSVRRILRTRRISFYKGLGINPPVLPGSANYYALVDVAALAERFHGRAFHNYLKANFTIRDFLLKLAGDYLTLCLPGEGFAASPWSIRVSLANLDSEAYVEIGENLRKTLDDILRGSPTQPSV